MKLIIDIPEKRYKDIIRISTIQAYSDYYPTYERIIANGTPIPDNATNEDIIKAIFPEVFVTNCKLVDKVGYFNFDLDWWKAPYQKGGK